MPRRDLLVAVAAQLESFYKPDLDAALNRPLQAIRRLALTVLKYPLRVYRSIGIPTHDLARQLQVSQDPQGRNEELHLLQLAHSREERSQGHLQAALLDEGAAREPRSEE